MKTSEEKYLTIISKNTFYFHNPEFEEKYEGYINSVKETLLVLKNEIITNGFRKEVISNLIAEKDHGLAAVLALVGLSDYSFMRLITLLRFTDDEELCRLVLRGYWSSFPLLEDFREWDLQTINSKMSINEFFREGITNLFFEGANNSFLAKALPLFELKKLSISNLQFNENSLVETLVRCSINQNSDFRESE